MNDTLPTTKTSGHNHSGRAAEGLDPTTATVEQLNFAAQLLYAAKFGLGTVTRGETIAGIGQTRTSSIAMRFKPLGPRYALHAIPMKSDVSLESWLTAGIFMGHIEALNPARTRQTVVGLAGEPGEESRALLFDDTRSAAMALNKLARTMGEIDLASKPGNFRRAIDCLSEISQRSGSVPFLE